MSTDETHSPCLTTSPEDSASYHTCWIGKPIHEELKSASTAVVRGITSRGIFLELDNGWIAFLSSEQFRGPLTLNLNTPFRNIGQITPGLAGKISKGLILFDDSNIQIQIAKIGVWSSLGLFLRIRDEYIMAMRNFEVDNFVYHLNSMLPSPNEYLEFAQSRLSKSPPPPASPLVENLDKFMNAIQKNNLDLLGAPVAFVAGRGRGLTPSGDDFLSGLLLGLFCNKQFRQKAKRTIKKAILDAIQSRSTRISANLAECAAVGEVDERISDAVNYLLIGEVSEESALSGIMDWGSSSGVDMIAGFISAIKLVD